MDGIVGPQTRGALRAQTQAHSFSAERDRSRVDRELRVEGDRRAPSETDLRATRPGTIPARTLQQDDAQRRNTSSSVRTTNDRATYERYASMVRAHGGRIDPTRSTVLGLRSRDGVTRGFEDRIVVLNPNGQVSEFSASTRPASTTRRGVAELTPGNYRVVPHRPHYDRPSWQVVTRGGDGNVPAYRDRNGDGRYSEAEKADPGTANGILFHVPNPRYGDRIPTSIGCINIRNRDYAEFMRAVGGPTSSFNFTLLGP